MVVFTHPFHRSFSDLFSRLIWKALKKETKTGPGHWIGFLDWKKHKYPKRASSLFENNPNKIYLYFVYSNNMTYHYFTMLMTESQRTGNPNGKRKGTGSDAVVWQTPLTTNSASQSFIPMLKTVSIHNDYWPT